ncbi:MAG: hypothetical protein ACI9R3_000238 [Verrucomicrobiales bacterium]|jgi:hypothetical protein
MLLGPEQEASILHFYRVRDLFLFVNSKKEHDVRAINR